MFNLIDRLKRSADLESEFTRRAPWVVQFVINGKTYGGFFDLTQDQRPSQFFEAFPDAERILELGSLEGGHSFMLASRPSVKSVLGIEGRPANVEKARFVQRLLKMKKVQFITANLEETNLGTFGTFDAVFCSGLLYHLPEPWKLVEQMVRVSPNLFLSTQYAPNDKVDTVLQGWRGMLYQEHGLADPLSGMSSHSFWPTLDSLQDMLRHYGYRTIRLIENRPDFMNGPLINLAAATS